MYLPDAINLMACAIKNQSAARARCIFEIRNCQCVAGRDRVTMTGQVPVTGQ